MQKANMPGESHSLSKGEDSVPITHESIETPTDKATEHTQVAESLKGELAVEDMQPPLQPAGVGSQQHMPLPRRGLYYAMIAGVMTGIVMALLTVVIILLNAGTFHAARLQIAVDRLTVKTALALAAWELLTVVLSLLAVFFAGCIIGRIAVRRRLGFLTGALAGAIFYLVAFLVSFISSYPGNLVINRTPLTAGNLVISFLLLCLWSLGGGLVSLFGTWVVTIGHLYYRESGG